MAVQYVMAPDPTNNTGAYDAAAAEAKRNAEKRELKNKRNRPRPLRECVLFITLIFLPPLISPPATFRAKVNASASASSGLLIPLFFNASLDSSNILP
jgi:hypothetical protein